MKQIYHIYTPGHVQHLKVTGLTNRRPTIVLRMYFRLETLFFFILSLLLN